MTQPDSLAIRVLTVHLYWGIKSSPCVYPYIYLSVFPLV